MSLHIFLFVFSYLTQHSIIFTHLMAVNFMAVSLMTVSFVRNRTLRKIWAGHLAEETIVINYFR